MNFSKFLGSPFLYRTPSAAASEVSLYNLKNKPQQDRGYNSELRNFDSDLFFYFESLKNSCIFEGKLIQSKFLFSFLFCLLIVFCIAGDGHMVMFEKGFSHSFSLVAQLLTVAI